MIIRSVTEQDIPSIVELLKLSLGESLMPKSIAFWRWKHVDNPFGKSPVLLAEENNQLIGVRAFMRWEWKQGDKIYKAVRAVDTATHPQHQGKGIFKKLTLQLVDQCKAEGFDFIFNTPNKISKAGYLKMGWVSNGKMNITIHPRISFGNRSPDFDTVYGLNPGRIKFANESTPAGLQTAASEQFIRWRYELNPNLQYYAFSDRENNPTYLTFFRLKPHRFGVEFRICDLYHTNPMNTKKYCAQLMEVVKESGANLITSAIRLNVFPSVSLSIGPEITTQPLTFGHNFLTFNSWKPSLGDMEVF